jgi:hypothetical protein
MISSIHTRSIVTASVFYDPYYKDEKTLYEKGPIMDEMFIHFA